MEISPLLIYFIGQLDSFNVACALTLFLGGIALVLMNIIKAVSYFDSSTNYELETYNVNFQRFWELHFFPVEAL